MAYKCILLKTALKFLDEQVTPDERKNILEILERICNDPLVDGITKFYFLAPHTKKQSGGFSTTTLENPYFILLI